MTSRFAALGLLMLTAAPVSAGDIATWTDADGVIHFGNPQFAPPGARTVEVQPANGMEVPDAPPVTRTRGGPATVVLEKQPNRQTIGFRGHYWTVGQSPRRYHR